MTWAQHAVQLEALRLLLLVTALLNSICSRFNCVAARHHAHCLWRCMCHALQAHLADLKQGRSTGDDVGMEQLNRQAWLGRLLLACLLNLVDVLTNELATFMSSCWESISPMGPKADPGLHSLTLALALLHDVLVPTYQGRAVDERGPKK